MELNGPMAEADLIGQHSHYFNEATILFGI